MNKKRLISGVLVLVLVLGLVACGGGGSAPAPTPTPSPPAQETPEAPTPEEPSLEFPIGDVTFMIPNAAGGGNDLATRNLIPGLTRNLGVTVVPINRTDGAGAVACLEVANATPDGQTILFFSPTLILLSHRVDELMMDEFQPVAQVAADSALIYVAYDAPWETLEEFVADAQAGGLRVAHTGNGTMWHLAVNLFADAIDADFQFIPYTEGGSAAIMAVAAGEVDMTIVNTAEGRALVEGQLVRPLAVVTDSRIDVFPDLPTVEETGIDFVFHIWRMIFTAVGTDPAILARLDEAFEYAVNSPEFQQFAEMNALTPTFLGHEAATTFFRDQVLLYDSILSELED